LMCRGELRDPRRVVIRLMVSQLLLDAADLRFELVDAVFHAVDGRTWFRRPAGPRRWDRTTGFAWLGRHDQTGRALPAPVEVAVVAEVHGHRAVLDRPEPRRDRIDEVAVVRDEDDGAFEVLQGLLEHLLGRDVEVVGGLGE